MKFGWQTFSSLVNRSQVVLEAAKIRGDESIVSGQDPHSGSSVGSVAAGRKGLVAVECLVGRRRAFVNAQQIETFQVISFVSFPSFFHSSIVILIFNLMINATG